MNKAIFLDRDGVINRDTGYVSSVQQFEFLPGVFAACRYLQQQGYLLIVVTNQSGIGRGLYSEKDFQQLTDWMLKQFQAEAVTITAVYYCPYHPTQGVGEYRQDSPYRKPGPQMILDAAQDFHIDLTQSVMVGDNQTDMQAGFNAGVKQQFLVGENTKFASLQTLVEEVFYSRSTTK